MPMLQTVAVWTAFGVASRLYSNSMKGAPLSSTPLRTMALGLMFGAVGYYYHHVKEEAFQVDEENVRKVVERKRREFDDKNKLEAS
ncbi:hypothetical protein HMI54_001941 [Coelomomyces lativittatus]|nr:hypothetical protein HMI54_001941 [Coelomomyces lativittatus]KAJ1514206.1 hypothetical protein HMI56_000938 [Coelomomyces lativittatus]KAJ1517177.1 hypothetical protein HMI55_000451 [Coelomomyces lativittatus]